MSKPNVSEADLHAYLDGELPAAQRAYVEGEVAADAQLAERVARYSELNEVLRAHYDPVLEEPIPERFAASASRPRWRRGLKFAAAAVLWFALGGLAGWQLHGVQSREDRAAAPVWAKRAAVAHIVYVPEVRHPVEVGADQEAHLVAWLSKRLGTPLRIPKLGGIGYNLVGGRLLPGEQGPAAQFMYQDTQGQRLTLYVRSNREHSGETAFRFAQDGNVRIFYWIDRGLGLALSGEIEKDELLRVATTVYQQLNP
jgi:anti-sigma factor RsiW